MPRNTDKFNYYTVAVPKKSRLQQKVDLDYEEMTIAEGQLILLYATKYIEAMERGIISEIKVIPPPDGRFTISFSIKDKTSLVQTLLELSEHTGIPVNDFAKKIFLMSVIQGKATKLELSDNTTTSVREVN